MKHETSNFRLPRTLTSCDEQLDEQPRARCSVYRQAPREAARSRRRSDKRCCPATGSADPGWEGLWSWQRRSLLPSLLPASLKDTQPGRLLGTRGSSEGFEKTGFSSSHFGTKQAPRTPDGRTTLRGRRCLKRASSVMRETDGEKLQLLGEVLRRPRESREN